MRGLIAGFLFPVVLFHAGDRCAEVSIYNQSLIPYSLLSCRFQLILESQESPGPHLNVLNSAPMGFLAGTGSSWICSGPHLPSVTNACRNAPLAQIQARERSAVGEPDFGPD
jgi:hypothetical protein